MKLTQPERQRVLYYVSMNSINKLSVYNLVKILTILIVMIETNNIIAAENTKERRPPYEVELSYICRNLVSKDLFSKSDPMVVLFIKETGKNNWIEFERTEAKKNTHDTNFNYKSVLTYNFDENQLLMFKIYDLDSKSSNLNDHDIIGIVTVTLGALVNDSHSILKLKDDKGKINDSELIIDAAELGGDKNVVTLGMIASGFKKSKSCFDQFKPYLDVYKKFDKGNYVKAFTIDESGKIAKTKNKTIGIKWGIKWGIKKIPVWLMCNGNYKRDLKFVCRCRNKKTDNYLGEFYTTLDDIQNKNEDSLDKNDPPSFKCVKKNDKNEIQIMAAIEIYHFKIEEMATFIDYIQKLTDVNCSIAIDFTKSNGEPTDPFSKHYISDNNSLNNYEQAIKEVTIILQDYDKDKQFDTLGFGAILPGQKKVSHVFYLKDDKTECYKMEGVIEAYRKRLKDITLYGPTYIAPVIKHVVQMVLDKNDKNGNHYFILLILTDGIIDDMEKTKEIAKAAKLAVSIIIVGIGNANFNDMEKLDGDIYPLIYRNKRVRDIVQFVEFNKHNGTSNLAKEVLHEIPTQFLEYMRLKSILPPTGLVPKNIQRSYNNNNTYP